MLNVTAVAKGLVAGAIRFCRRDGSVIDAATEREGILMPNLREVLSVDMTQVKWMVVIEKEATFRSIAASCFWDTISSHGLIITGKGYPDIATRAMLRFLSSSSPLNGFASPPVFGLADCDPDGLAILSVYKHGSLALLHENADLRVPQLQWLGLCVEHMAFGGDSVHGSQGVLTLTARDRRKAVGMLRRCVTADPSENNENFRIYQALQSMLMLNTKAELQLLDETPEAMTRLLEHHLGSM